MKKLFKLMASTRASLFKNYGNLFLSEQNFDAILNDAALPMGAILVCNLNLILYVKRNAVLSQCYSHSLSNPSFIYPTFLYTKL